MHELFANGLKYFFCMGRFQHLWQSAAATVHDPILARDCHLGRDRWEGWEGGVGGDGAGVLAEYWLNIILVRYW